MVAMCSMNQWRLPGFVQFWVLLASPGMYECALHREGALELLRNSSHGFLALDPDHEEKIINVPHMTVSMQEHAAGASSKVSDRPWWRQKGLWAAVVGLTVVTGCFAFTSWWHSANDIDTEPSSECDLQDDDIRNSRTRFSYMFEPSMKKGLRGGTINTKYWAALADDGELDVYTCFGLAMDKDPWGPTARHLLPTIFSNCALQMVLPILLAIYQVRTFRPYSTNDDWVFRILGFMLFLYSIWNMYHGALDKCRSIILDHGLDHDVSPYAMIPMIIGEIANALLACTMAFTLFSIFCTCVEPTQMIINCVSANFIITVDNNFVSADHQEEAQKHLEKSIEKWKAPLTNRCLIVWRRGAMLVCQFLRVFGTLICGGSLAFVFLFASQKQMCQMMRAVEPWPFCLGLPS